MHRCCVQQCHVAAQQRHGAGAAAEPLGHRSGGIHLGRILWPQKLHQLVGQPRTYAVQWLSCLRSSGDGSCNPVSNALHVSSWLSRSVASVRKAHSLCRT